MLKHVLVHLILLLPFGGNAQVTNNPDEAFSWSVSLEKPVLLVFQGSDWCLPCMKLERKVLSTDSFVNFADENLIVLKADFPQRKKIDPTLTKQYEQLADTYNPEGVFPKMILISPAKKTLGIINTDYAKPEQLIEKLKQELKLYHEKV